MEAIQGKKSLDLDFNELRKHLTSHNRIALDLGTGDGRYVHTLAARHPDWFMIGVDACRENLSGYSRARLSNMLFIIARAQELPGEFTGLFSHITINFPWGSLLEGFLAGDPGLLHGLTSVAYPGTQIEIHLNSSALEQAGSSMQAGAMRIQENMSGHGWKLKEPVFVNSEFLKVFPSTWAKRMAYGRDPRAVSLHGSLRQL